MVYSLENVKKLKKVTGIGIKKCMEALNNNDNDFDKSLEWLKKYSISVRNISSSSSGEVSFGVTFLKALSEKAVSFVLSCESDFAEKSEEFIKLSEEIGDMIFKKFEDVTRFSLIEKEVEELVEERISSVSLSIKEKISIRNINLFTKREGEEFGIYLHHNRKLCSLAVIRNGTKEIAHEIALQVAVHKPLFVSKDTVPASVVKARIDEIRENLSEDVKEKSLSIVENVVNGKINKWYSEVCLLEREDFRNNERSVGEIVSPHGAVVEKIFFEKI